MLEAVYGCMFAGKTTRYIKIAEERRRLGLPTVCVKHAWDNRYGTEQICSHDRVTTQVDYAGTHLLPIMSQWSVGLVTPQTLVMVDEAQFFPDLAEFIGQVRARYPGTSMLICGLDRNFRDEWFGDMQTVVERLADVRTHLYARCHRGCVDLAVHSHRTVRQGGDILIGGAESYIPLCGGCYRELNRVPGSPS
jgi:thymidine kinase